MLAWGRVSRAEGGAWSSTAVTPRDGSLPAAQLPPTSTAAVLGWIRPPRLDPAPARGSREAAPRGRESTAEAGQDTGRTARASCGFGAPTPNLSPSPSPAAPSSMKGGVVFLFERLPH